MSRYGAAEALDKKERDTAIQDLTDQIVWLCLFLIRSTVLGITGVRINGGTDGCR